MLLVSIPSPGRREVSLGPLTLRAYGALIAIGVLVAIAVAEKRWERRGGEPGTISTIALWAVPAGLVGARLYHVATDYRRFQGHWIDVFKVWTGGLGIWGAVAAGALVGALVARRLRVSVPTVLDVAAPALALAQAIGRWGNWFNQELFGGPTALPWGLRIDATHRPPGYERFSTFHPTFLYESLWCLGIAAFLVWVDRRRRLRPGKLFILYIVLYTFGRFWIERLRIDEATIVVGLRINEWTSLVIFLVALGLLLFWRVGPVGRHVASVPVKDSVPVKERSKPGMATEEGSTKQMRESEARVVPRVESVAQDASGRSTSPGAG